MDEHEKWVRSPKGLVEASRNDILLGRGKHAKQWEGNLFFRAIIKERAEEYRLAHENSKKRDKIASEVLAKIYKNGRRFLRMLRLDTDTPNRWIVLSKSDARNKVKQAMRDATKTNVSQSAVESRRRSRPSSQEPRSLMKRHCSSSLEECTAERSEVVRTPLRESHLGGWRFRPQEEICLSMQSLTARSLLPCCRVTAVSLLNRDCLDRNQSKSFPPTSSRTSRLVEMSLAYRHLIAFITWLI